MPNQEVLPGAALSNGPSHLSIRNVVKCSVRGGRMYRPRPYDSVCGWTHIYVTRLPYLVCIFSIITPFSPFLILLRLIESSSFPYFARNL
jgi:hypothetical protein